MFETSFGAGTEGRGAMRTLLFALTTLVTCLAVSWDAVACRGPIHSVAEIVQQSSSIFTAKVISHPPSSAEQGVIELRVIEVLKGSVPETVRAKGNLLVHPNDSCLAIEAATPAPHISVGEQWLVSGDVDADGNVVLPMSGGNFRLSRADGTSLEGSDKLLSEFRHLLSARPQSGVSAR